MSAEKKTRWIFGLAVFVWAIGWVLPALVLGGDTTFWGWQCFQAAGIHSFELMGSKEADDAWSYAEAASPWTNLLVPLLLIALARSRWRRLLPYFPVLLVASGVLGLVWLRSEQFEPGGLRVGYYVWVASFWLLGAASRGLVGIKSADAEQALSPITPRGRLLLTMFAGLAMLVMVALLGIAFLK